MNIFIAFIALFNDETQTLDSQGEENDTQQIIFRTVTGCNFFIQFILLGWEQDRQNNSLAVKTDMGNRKEKKKEFFEPWQWFTYSAFNLSEIKFD